MSKEIDFITLEENNPEYPFSMEAYEYNKPSGGCRTRNKNDLKAMYQLWKETYGTLNLKYIFKKNEEVLKGVE